VKIVGLLRFFKDNNPLNWQWQPSLTAHDPNPPFNLEDGGSSPINYTLIGAPGSYAYTGQAATYAYTSGSGAIAYALAGDRAAYAYTGQSAAFTVGRKLTGASAAYVYSAQSGTFVLARKLAGGSAAYAYTGQAATYTYTSGSGAIAYALAGDRAAYAYTGQSAAFTLSSVQPSAFGGYYENPHARRRTKEELRAERVLMGILKEPEAKKAIRNAESIPAAVEAIQSELLTELLSRAAFVEKNRESIRKIVASAVAGEMKAIRAERQRADEETLLLLS